MQTFSVIEKLYVAVQIRLYIFYCSIFSPKCQFFFERSKKAFYAYCVECIGRKTTLYLVFTIHTIAFCLSVRLPLLPRLRINAVFFHNSSNLPFADENAFFFEGFSDFPTAIDLTVFDEDSSDCLYEPYTVLVSIPSSLATLVADLPPSSTYLTVCSFISSLYLTFPIVVSFLYLANAYDTTFCPLMQIHTSPMCF